MDLEEAAPYPAALDIVRREVKPKRAGASRAAHRLTSRLDYILVSPELADLVAGGGINRNSLWGTPTNKHLPTDWDVFPPITQAVHAASDHAAVWIDINL